MWKTTWETTMDLFSHTLPFVFAIDAAFLFGFFLGGLLIWVATRED